MRGAMLFLAGLFTGLAVHVAMAQNANHGVVMMNHVGINVPNIEEGVKYYTEKMGYREAFRVNDDKGQPRITGFTSRTPVKRSPCSGSAA